MFFRGGVWNWNFDAEDKKFNSPNDVCVKSDGTIWFTDPPYGILSDYEGYVGEQEYEGCYVFKFDPKLNILEVISKLFIIIVVIHQY